MPQQHSPETCLKSLFGSGYRFWWFVKLSQSTGLLLSFVYCVLVPHHQCKFHLVLVFQTQMWKRRGIRHCFWLVPLVCAWVCMDAVPIAVDKSKAEPPAKEMDPPESTVSESGLTIIWGLCNVLTKMWTCVQNDISNSWDIGYKQIIHSDRYSVNQFSIYNAECLLIRTGQVAVFNFSI